MRICTIILLFCSLALYSQKSFNVLDIDIMKLPQVILFEGKVKKAIRYSDTTGDYVILLTETGIYQNPKFTHESDGEDGELFAYQFLIENDRAVPTWKVYDYVTDCPVDVEASFLKDTLRITDLDNDGAAEVWVMYKLACRGDVSPSEMKIIMYEGMQKFAMRGSNKVFGGTDDNGIKHYIGGEYTFDPAFANGPKEFRDFAKKQWNDNIMEVWEE